MGETEKALISSSPLDFVVSSVERWGRLGGDEREMGDHPLLTQTSR